MKILVTKKEFADIVRTCSSDGDCTFCVLSHFCCQEEEDKKIEDFCEIVEEPDEQQK